MDDPDAKRSSKRKRKEPKRKEPKKEPKKEHLKKEPKKKERFAASPVFDSKSYDDGTKLEICEEDGHTWRGCTLYRKQCPCTR